MNFSMFSWSNFLSDIKQSVMSQRAQESNTEEVSAVAKPRPMNMVSKNLLSAKQTSWKDSGASNSPGNQELNQSSVSRSTRKPARDRVQNPATNSQVWQQDDNPFWCTRKLGRSGESAS